MDRGERTLRWRRHYLRSAAAATRADNPTGQPWQAPLISPPLEDADILARVRRDRRHGARFTSLYDHGVVALIPDAWLGDEPLFANVAEHRAAYTTYLLNRLDVPRVFVEEAIDARTRLL